MEAINITNGDIILEFIYLVSADNLLCTWLTDHIYAALTGFTYVATSITVSVRGNRNKVKTKMSGFLRAASRRRVCSRYFRKCPALY